MLNRILAVGKANTPNADLINVVMLRSMSQAEYSPDNIGHFGLALHRYAHFTSPIRRYADLIVHRALIRTYKMGRGRPQRHRSRPPERRRPKTSPPSNAAPWRPSATRPTATSPPTCRTAWAPSSSAESPASPASACSSASPKPAPTACFPIRALGREFFHHDERAHALIGEKSGLTFRLGDTVRVRLEEATPLTGGLRFDLIDGGNPGSPMRVRSAKREPKRHTRRR